MTLPVVMAGSQTRLAVAPALYRKFIIDVTKDFTGVAMVGVSPAVAEAQQDHGLTTKRTL